MNNRRKLLMPLIFSKALYTFPLVFDYRKVIRISYVGTCSVVVCMQPQNCIFSLMTFTYRLLRGLLKSTNWKLPGGCGYSLLCRSPKYNYSGDATAAPRNATLEFAFANASKRKNVVNLTPRAQEQILKIIDGSSQIVRLSLKKKGCNGFAYDMQLCSLDGLHELDEVVHANGVPILAIENSAIFHLLNSKIDYMEGELESGFIFENPNIVSTCGCGVSFHF